LHLVDEYINLMIALESVLTEYRLHLSKTKATVGFANASASFTDFREMDEVVRVQVDDGSFALDQNEVDDEEESTVVNRKKQQNTDVKEQKSMPKNYMPFGILEPQSAKHARSAIDKALLLTCELASVQQKIKILDGS